MANEDREIKNSAALRSLSGDLGLLNKTDGSACFSHGNTSAMAGVYGPAEVRFNKEIVNKATVEVVYRPKTGIPGCAEKSMERLIRNTCESAILTSMHPRSAMTIVLQEICNDGSLISCCINAGCMAMLNAGYPMRYLIASITIAILDDDVIITDPDGKQEKNAKAVITFAFDSVNKDIILLTSKGKFSINQFETCLMVARDCSQKIFDFYRTSIGRFLSKDVKFMDLNIAKQ
ncbi:exosome complex component RRP46-like [Xenia sp. Carnegie-2017]|uniref:exosome complex component RRP46-like n=1 Tax=Xenia sp. Carnegie-2017 TaxID=2897299 RepID=UPI001F03B552|nr:exosome complex component RRP46-like [Xenia sp. Carnegie-2017]